MISFLFRDKTDLKERLAAEKNEIDFVFFKRNYEN